MYLVPCFYLHLLSWLLVGSLIIAPLLQFGLTFFLLYSSTFSLNNLSNLWMNKNAYLIIGHINTSWYLIDVLSLCSLANMLLMKMIVPITGYDKMDWHWFLSVAKRKYRMNSSLFLSYVLFFPFHLACIVYLYSWSINFWKNLGILSARILPFPLLVSVCFGGCTWVCRVSNKLPSFIKDFVSLVILWCPVISRFVCSGRNFPCNLGSCFNCFPFQEPDFI